MTEFLRALPTVVIEQENSSIEKASDFFIRFLPDDSTFIRSLQKLEEYILSQNAPFLGINHKQYPGLSQRLAKDSRTKHRQYPTQGRGFYTHFPALHRPVYIKGTGFHGKFRYAQAANGLPSLEHDKLHFYDTHDRKDHIKRVLGLYQTEGAQLQLENLCWYFLTLLMDKYESDIQIISQLSIHTIINETHFPIPLVTAELKGVSNVVNKLRKKSGLKPNYDTYSSLTYVAPNDKRLLDTIHLSISDIPDDFIKLFNGIRLGWFPHIDGGFHAQNYYDVQGSDEYFLADHADMFFIGDLEDKEQLEFLSQYIHTFISSLEKSERDSTFTNLYIAWVYLNKNNESRTEDFNPQVLYVNMCKNYNSCIDDHHFDQDKLSYTLYDSLAQAIIDICYPWWKQLYKIRRSLNASYTSVATQTIACETRVIQVVDVHLFFSNDIEKLKLELLDDKNILFK
jgi:hypothetical protein